MARKPKDTLGIRLDPKHIDALHQRAQAHGVTQADYLRAIVADVLENEDLALQFSAAVGSGPLDSADLYARTELAQEARFRGLKLREHLQALRQVKPRK